MPHLLISNLMFIIANYTVFCRLMSSGVRWKKEQLKASLTPESLSPQESQFTGLTFLVNRFRFSETRSKPRGNSFLTKAFHFSCQTPTCFIQSPL